MQNQFVDFVMYNKTCVKRPLSKEKKMFSKTNNRLMQDESIAEYSKGGILQYFRPSFVIKIFVLSIFEWSFYTGFTVQAKITKICLYFFPRQKRYEGSLKMT